MRGSAVAFAFLLVSSAVPAQNFGPLPPLTAHVDVQVVNVDVTVTDTDGKPVMDLTKDDFEILEDAKPQKITNFSVMQDSLLRDAAHPAAAGSKGEMPPQFRRKLLLLVDNNYIEKSERDIALGKIERYLEKTLNGDFEYAVAAIGHGVHLVQPFTSDMARIHAAFEAVRRMPVLTGRQEMDRKLLSDRERRGEASLNQQYDYGELLRFSGREQTFRNLMAITETANAVAEAARAHAADEGKKFIILLTGGMESNTSFTAYDKKTDQEMQALKLDIAQIEDQMIREANAASFTVHVINARTRGMQAPQHDVENGSSGINLTSPNLYQTGGLTDPIDTHDLDSLPLGLALGTGGMYLPSNDIAGSMSTIDRQTTNFYSLGYSPAHQGDRRYHRIRVNVKRRGVRVANRVGYYDLTADDRLEEMLRARTTFDRGMGSLPVTIAVSPVKRPGEQVMAVTAELPLEKVTIIPRDNGYVGRVHVYLSVFDESGHNVAFHHQEQEVTIDRKESVAGHFRYTMKVHLQRGNFTVIMTLRDELSNDMGSAREAVRL